MSRPHHFYLTLKGFWDIPSEPPLFLIACILLTGSIQVGGFSIREMAMQDIVVVQPQHLGGRVVFKAKSISLHPSWSILRGVRLRTSP